MMKKGFMDIPEECRHYNKGSTENWFSWAKKRVFGGKDACEV